MKKLAVLVVVAVGLLAVAGGLMQSSGDAGNGTPSTSEQKESQSSDPNTISISDFAFKTKVLTISKGTKVTWTNADEAHHDITPDEDYGSAFTGSSLLNQGDSYSFTFEEPGTYAYHCSPHPYMKAVIEVMP